MKPIPMPPLDGHSILKSLRTKWLGRSILILDRCTSTNDIAAKLAHDDASHGLTVVAEEQIAGRGRQGRVWFSPMGGIWLTILFRAPFIFDPLNALPLVGCLAIARAISSNLGVQSRVRWPNDVVVDRRKLSGVLVEAKSKGNELEYALLGIGINANFRASLIKEISETSTSLLELLGSPIDREALICSILLEMEHLHEILSSRDPEAVMILLQQFECSRGKRVSVRLQDREIAGVFDNFDGLTKVRIGIPEGAFESIDTSSVVVVEYLDD